MPKVFCKNCGRSAMSVQSLVAGTCPRHPLGPCKGKHQLYEGAEKSKYTCKYCGRTSSTIQSLVAGTCPRHPLGSCKGKHSPAL